MTQSNAAQISNVSNIPPRPDNLHEAIEALHTAQITGEYRYTALGMAGALISEVGKIFPLHMILIYMATSSKRRQVWHSYIAAVYSNPADPQPITNPIAVREKLMNTSSKELVQEAYGSVPSGFLTALNRLGLNGQEPRIYLLMHKFMSESPELRKAFSHASKIDASTIITLAALPAPLQSYDLATQFRKPEDIKTLLFMVKTLARGDDAKYNELCELVVTAAGRNHSVSAVLKRYYYLTPFPEPILPDTEFCKHIGNAFELKKAALQFKCCLKQFVPEAIRQEYVYYRWYVGGRPTAVISLRQDHPYGWRVEEIKGKDNLFLDDKDELPIIQYFEEHGVYKMASMEGLLRELGYLGVVNRSRRQNDPVDDINQVIDELLDDDPV